MNSKTFHTDKTHSARKKSSAIISGVHPESDRDQESSSDSDEQLHMLNFRRKKPGEASIYRIFLAKRHGSSGRAMNYSILYGS